MVDGPFPYVPVDGRRFRLAMGLRPLDERNWFEFASDGDEQIALKRRLLVDARDEVLFVADEGREGAQLLADRVASHLRAHHPTRSLGDDPEPLAAAALAVPDDLCVMTLRDGDWRLSAACVCFPSRWRLSAKRLATLDEIHGPVPHYDHDLARPTRLFFDRLQEDRPMWRLNWTLLDDDSLFQPAAARRSPSSDPDRWQFRVERQSLVRLCADGPVAFTIRTYVTTAASLVATVPGFSEAVTTVLETAPADTLGYKGWTGLAARWREWFD